jgi:hypothetical protein
MEQDLLQQLTEKVITKEQLFKLVEKDFELLPLVIGGVSSSKASVRYSCASVLADLTAKHPEKLYPHIDFFVSLLDSKYRILVWNGLAAIANLCAVDVDKKFDDVFGKYYGFLGDEYMVTVANVVGNSGKIALAKPYLTTRITTELLHVDKLHVTPHLTDEGKRVIAEKAVETFDTYFYLMGDEEKVKVLSFVKKQWESSRASLQKKAEAFLKRRRL